AVEVGGVDRIDSLREARSVDQHTALPALRGSAIIAHRRDDLRPNSIARNGWRLLRLAARIEELEERSMFQISALPRCDFEEWIALDDEQLAKRGGRRYVADRKPGFPCRVSLADAA